MEEYMHKTILFYLLTISFLTSTSAQENLFRSGIFLHHSTGGCIWGPNGSATSVPQEIDAYNSSHGYTGSFAVSLNEEWWPVDPWDNEWSGGTIFSIATIPPPISVRTLPPTKLS